MLNIEPYIDALHSLNKDDRTLVLEYYKTWTPEYPAEFADGLTMENKIEQGLETWLDLKDLDGVDTDDVLQYGQQNIMDYVYLFGFEFEPNTIVNISRGIYDHELFQDILDEYLAEQN